MFFDQLLAKFRTNSAKRIGNKRAGAQQGEPRSRSLTEQPYLQPNENFNTTIKLNTAFSDIEKAIQIEGPSNELLLKKAEREKNSRNLSKNIEEIQKNSKQNQLKSNACLAKQSVLAAKAKKLNFQLPEKINERTNIKALVFKQARACLGDNPQACLSLVDSILDYFPGDLAPLQLKGEALAELKENDEAIQIWKELTHSKTEKIAKKARALISLVLTQEAGPVSANRPPKAVISSIIKQHLNYNLAPELNKEISEILLKIEPLNSDSSIPELRQHQLQLLLNTLTIEFLEAHLRK